MVHTQRVPYLRTTKIFVSIAEMTLTSVPLYFVGNYMYELPFGKGHRFLASAGRALDALVGGWQTSGIITRGAVFLTR